MDMTKSANGDRCELVRISNTLPKGSQILNTYLDPVIRRPIKSDNKYTFKINYEKKQKPLPLVSSRDPSISHNIYKRPVIKKPHKNISQMVALMKYLNLERHIGLFVVEEIDLEVLRMLSMNDLKLLGLNMYERLIMRKYIKADNNSEDLLTIKDVM